MLKYKREIPGAISTEHAKATNRFDIAHFYTSIGIISMPINQSQLQHSCQEHQSSTISPSPPICNTTN